MLTPDELHLYLEYNPETGEIWHRDIPENHHNARGKRACNGAFKGYLRGRVKGKAYLAHRVIFAMHHGYWPEVVDHEDQVGTHNWVSNLRDVSHEINMKNAKRTKGRELPMGVHAHKGKFRAVIGVKSKLLYLGSFKNLDEAIAARKAAERLHNFHMNHGK